MYYTTVERIVPGTDGVHNLYGKIFIPIGTPKATLQIIHGMAEHTGRYEEFMKFMCRKGYVVFMHDQLGHGKTAVTSQELGVIAEADGDEYLVDDAFAVAKDLLKSYSGLKHILFGHSMGSFVSRLCAEKYPQMVDLLIITGSGGPQKAAQLGLAITEFGSKIAGTDYRSEFTQKMMLDMYNYNFKDEDNDYSWTTRDEKMMESHKNDEYGNFTFSIKAMNDIVALSTKCNSDGWFEKFPKNLPILIISGEKDPVGGNGKGIMEVYKNLQSQGVEDVSFKLYSDCRHELLNELNREEVIADILVWLGNRINKKQ